MENETKKYINPEQIVVMTISDPEPSTDLSICSNEIIKVDARPWYTKLFHPNSEPKYEYRIKKRVLRYVETFTFEEFFNDPENQETYLYPVIENGVLLNNSLLLKPNVTLYCSNGKEYRARFENVMERDRWLAETGLDKILEKFIQTNKKTEKNFDK